MSGKMKKDSSRVDHFKLLCDFGELNWIFADSNDIDTFLHKIVTMVCRHTYAGACTIFLYNEDTGELVLRATEGFTRECVGKVKFKLGEGLTGYSLEELKPVCVDVAKDHPRFKHVEEIDDGRYESYLAVPIVRGISRIGVITIHRKKEKPFNRMDTQALNAIASQLANILENTRIITHSFPESIITPHRRDLSLEEGKMIRGMSGSEGSALGAAFIFDRDRSLAGLLESEFDVKYSLEDFKKALDETETQLNKLQGKVGKKLDDAASLIFTSHLLILKDQVFIDEIISLIRGGENPPDALLKVSKRYIDVFVHSTNQYVQEKVQDVEDLVLRIIGNLDKKRRELVYVKGRVVIAHQLYPSDILMLSSEEVAGVVQVNGGVTSHVSILARSLQIPLIIVDKPELMDVPAKTKILIDADEGNLYINPDAGLINRFGFGRKHSRHIDLKRAVLKPETVTRDGVRIRLLANINLYNDLKQALALNVVEGVGLYRTEFPFLIRNDFPTEEEQYVIYRRIVRAVKGKEIAFRTLDIGGDKVLAYYEDYNEENPFLGMRSIRFSLKNKGIFRKQIRAMLRACAEVKPRIMFPMISSLDEFIEARTILYQCRNELKDEGFILKHEPSVGMLLEVPSIVEIINELAGEADFFSIGTNDFVQYMIGVDRTNEKVADYYLPHHPAVLRSLKRIVDGVLEHGREISVCGEMAHQLRYIPFLLGIGIRILSMNAVYLPSAQQLISSLSVEEAEETAAEILASASISEIESLLDKQER